jgi:hypothetical protein
MQENTARKPILIGQEKFKELWGKEKSEFFIFEERPISSILAGDKLVLSTPTMLGLEILATVSKVVFGATGRMVILDPASMVFVEIIKDHPESEPTPENALPPIYAERHNDVRELLHFFKYGHLPLELQAIVEPICSTIDILLPQIDDSPELTVGLRKLLEAKDCFVRAKLISKKREGA